MFETFSWGSLLMPGEEEQQWLCIFCVFARVCAWARLKPLPRLLPLPNLHSNNKAYTCQMGTLLCHGNLKFCLIIQKIMYYISVVPLQSEFVEVVLSWPKVQVSWTCICSPSSWCVLVWLQNTQYLCTVTMSWITQGDSLPALFCHGVCATWGNAGTGSSRGR